MDTALERLIAAEEIRSLKARYFRDIESKDWLDLAQVFTADARFDLRWVSCVLDPVTRVWTSPVGGDDHVFEGRDRIVGVIQGALEELVTVHRGFAPEIEVVSATEARGLWPMEDILKHRSGRLLLNGSGHYHDSYEKTASGWQIKSCRITRISLGGPGVPIK
jgi:hypothetical protein